jgi:hypothetical protein
MHIDYILYLEIIVVINVYILYLEIIVAINVYIYRKIHHYCITSEIKCHFAICWPISLICTSIQSVQLCLSVHSKMKYNNWNHGILVFELVYMTIIINENWIKIEFICKFATISPNQMIFI